jgi:hypothetical protein
LTKEELIRWALERMERYLGETTPHERFQQMIADGVIDKEGNVLISWGGENNLTAPNGQDEQQQKNSDTGTGS